MLSQKSITFCKRVSCPSEEMLLSFQLEELSPKQMAKVQKHLQNCEFCCAELELLSHYPPQFEICAMSEIPAALRQLAEALLGDRKAKSRLLQELVSEKESLQLTDA